MTGLDPTHLSLLLALTPILSLNLSAPTSHVQPFPKGVLISVSSLA